MQIVMNPPRPKRSLKILNTLSFLNKNMSAKNQNSENLEYVRRTITIAPKINKAIQDFRIELMKNNPNVEYDYTSVVNAALAYGIVFLNNYARSEDDDKEAVSYIGDRYQLVEYGLGDVVDTIRRHHDEEQKENARRLREEDKKGKKGSNVKK